MEWKSIQYKLKRWLYSFCQPKKKKFCISLKREKGFSCPIVWNVYTDADDLHKRNKIIQNFIWKQVSAATTTTSSEIFFFCVSELEWNIFANIRIEAKVSVDHFLYKIAWTMVYRSKNSFENWKIINYTLKNRENNCQIMWFWNWSVTFGSWLLCICNYTCNSINSFYARFSVGSDLLIHIFDRAYRNLHTFRQNKTKKKRENIGWKAAFHAWLFVISFVWLIFIGCAAHQRNILFWILCLQLPRWTNYIQQIGVVNCIHEIICTKTLLFSYFC